MTVTMGARATKSPASSATRASREHVGFSDALYECPSSVRDEFRRIGIDDVVHRCHHAALHQHLDDIDTAPRHAVGEL